MGLMCPRVLFGKAHEVRQQQALNAELEAE
jgi:hypothetical protein